MSRPTASWMDAPGSRRALLILCIVGIGALAVSITIGAYTGFSRNHFAPLGALRQQEVARAYAEAGEIDLAIAEFASEARMNHLNRRAVRRQAKLLQHLGRDEEARAVLAAAADNTLAPGVHIDLAHALAESGDNAGALRVIERALRTDPELPVYHTWHGTYLAATGDLEAAAAAFRRSLELDPAASGAREGLLSVYSRAPYLRQGAARKGPPS